MATRSNVGAPLIGRLWPGESVGLSGGLRLVLLALVGTLILALSARVQVPMWPVPMTMQTFAVLVIGMTYGLRLGTATVALYLVQGAVGLPVFATGAGLAYMAGPTGGYLIGFLVAAAIVGWAAGRGWDRLPVLAFAANVLAIAALFALGIAWLTVLIGDFGQAIASGLMPFMLGELVKILLVTALLPGAWRLVGRR